MGQRSDFRGLLRPDRQVASVVDVRADELRTLGIQGVILDLDDTLVAQLEKRPTEAIRAWLEPICAQFSTYIVSNNWSARRVAEVADVLGIPHVCRAAKPRRGGFCRALSAMGLQPDQVAIVGDQLFTDVLGGNRLGSYTVLVQPLSGEEHKPFRRWMRKAEAWALARLGVGGSCSPCGDREPRGPGLAPGGQVESEHAGDCRRDPDRR